MIIFPRTILASVFDKTKLKDFLYSLASLNDAFSVIASEGTRKALTDSPFTLISVAEITGHNLDEKSLVKTLDHKLFRGILHNDLSEDELVIDMVIGNLYPFEDLVEEQTDWEKARDFIDIGGVSLLRAAAKNHSRVIVASSPKQYATLVEECRERGGVSLSTRRNLATEAFSTTAHYDSIITQYLHNNVS